MGPAGGDPKMLNYGTPMYPGHCDSSVFSVLQNKIPDDGGDYYLY